MPGRGSKMSKETVVRANFGLFQREPNEFLRDWRLWTKPGCITITCRQNNCQWSGSIAAHTARKIFWVQKSAEKLLALIIWDQDGYLPKGRSSNAEYYSSLLVKLNDILKENAAESSPRTFSCTKMLLLNGHLQPRRSWHTWDSSVLITHPILRIWRRQITTRSLD